MAKSKYDEIINLPHHVSGVHPQMPMSDRAAQFAPFAALTGYEDAVKETGRLTDDRIEQDESTLSVLDAKLKILKDCLGDAPEISFTYFKPDEHKMGGAYLTAAGTVWKIDEYERKVIFCDGTELLMDDILDMQGDIFSVLDR